LNKVIGRLLLTLLIPLVLTWSWGLGGATGTLIGRVLDASGQPAGQVKVRIVREETQQHIVTQTNGDGLFRVELDAGGYSISVEQGRQSSTLAKVSLRAGEERRLAVRLPVSQDRIGGQGDKGSESNGPGRRSDAKGASLAAIRDYQIGLGGFRPTASSDKTLAEIVNPFPAQKRGRFHGALYEFHRNDNFDARNFFDPLGQKLPEYKRNQFGVSLGTTVRQNLSFFGSYEGLRIIKGSTLLSHVPTADMKRGDFGALGTELRDPFTGEILPENRIPAGRIHPVATKLLEVLPDPNQSDPDRNFLNNQPNVRHQDSYSFRFDYQGSEDAKIYFQYSLTDADRVDVHPLPDFGTDQTLFSQYTTVTYNRTVGSRLVTEGRLTFSRYLNRMLSRNSGREGLLDSLGIAGLDTDDPLQEGYPEFSLNEYASVGDQRSPYKWLSNRFSFDGSATYAMGGHTLRMGGDVVARQVNDTRIEGMGRGRLVFNGYYTGDAFADFLFGLPAAASRPVGSERTDLRKKSWGVSLGDQWRVNPQISLTLGVLYRYASPYRSVSDNVSGFFPLLFEPPTEGQIVIAGSQDARRLGLDQAGDGGLVFPDRNDWAPEMGLAFSPFGNNQLVLRSSYTIHYGSAHAGHYARYLNKNFPFYYVESAEAPVDSPDLDLGNPFEHIAPTELTVRGLETTLRNPYVQRWLLTMQGEVNQYWNLEASYRGRKGSHMLRTLASNIPLPDSGSLQPRRPNPEFGLFRILTSGGSLSSHQLDLAAERRLSEGLSLKSGFTWTRSLDDVFSDPSNPRNLRAEKARTGYIPERQFFLNYIIELPPGRSLSLDSEGSSLTRQLLQGWRLSGITYIQDGTPFSALLAGDANNDGVDQDRPDLLGPTSVDSSDQTVDRWFLTEAFSQPDAFSFGDAGRNILTGPGYQKWDVSMIKQTRLSNGDFVELRVQLFNAFNHVNFRRPNAVYGNTLFGKIFGARHAREIEVALKYSF